MKIPFLDHYWQLPKLTEATKLDYPIAKSQAQYRLFDAPGQFAKGVNCGEHTQKKTEVKKKPNNNKYLCFHFAL